MMDPGCKAIEDAMDQEIWSGVVTKDWRRPVVDKDELKTAMVPREPTELKSAGLAVRTIEELNAVLDVLEGVNILPDYVKSRGDAAATILAGAELGLPPMAAFRSLFIVKGKVGMFSALVLSRLKKYGYHFRWTETDITAHTIALWAPGGKGPPQRKDDGSWSPPPDHEETFTMEDANRANLPATNPTWNKYPKAMLKARCVTAAARAFAPEVFFGAVYTPEELQTGGIVEAEFVEVTAKSAVQKDVRADDPEKYDDAHAQEKKALDAAKVWADSEDVIPWLKAVRDDCVEQAKTAPDSHALEAFYDDQYNRFKEWFEGQLETIEGLPGRSPKRKQVWDWMLKALEAMGVERPKRELQTWRDEIIADRKRNGTKAGKQADKGNKGQSDEGEVEP